MTAQLFLFPEARQMAATDHIHGFDQFWAAYPHKVCKGQARRAYAGALGKVSLAELLDGLRRYMRDKPDDIPWCNPATFLNGERWADEPATRCRTSDPRSVELRRLKSCAGMIANGINVASITRREAAEMVARGWLTKDQACKAGLD